MSPAIPKPPKAEPRARSYNSTLPRPTKGLSTTKPIKPRNAKRKAKEWARAYGSPERVAFIASLPCVVPGCLVTPCENAHTAGDNGMGRKSSARYVIPCCAPHHREQHAVGAGTFALKYRLNLAQLASMTERLWQESQP